MKDAEGIAGFTLIPGPDRPHQGRDLFNVCPVIKSMGVADKDVIALPFYWFLRQHSFRSYTGPCWYP